MHAAAAAAAGMNHSARLRVYISCEMSCQPACLPDVTLRARRRVISVVFIRRVSESRNCAANEPLANDWLNHHSAVAKDQPPILTACAELRSKKHKTAKLKRRDCRREDEASAAL